MNKIPTPGEIEIDVDHPHGRVTTTLDAWIETGPGKRPLVRPIAARDLRTGQPVSILVVPLRYRNNWFSRLLIRLGILKDPWG